MLIAEGGITLAAVTYQIAAEKKVGARGLQFGGFNPKPASG